MIVDISNNLGEPWGTRLRQTPEELLRRMDANGVDVAVVSSFPFGNFDNDYVARAIARHPDRFVGFALVSPFAEQTPREVIDHYVGDLGFKGVRLNPNAHGYKFADEMVADTILAVCAEQRLPVLAYSGDEVYATPLQFYIAAEKYPTIPFIMQHSGFMVQTVDAIWVAKRCPNVYLEHSSGYTAAITDSVMELGADRVLFGTDTPTERYEVSRYMHELAIEDGNARQAVLGGNAVRLLGM